MTMLQFLQKHTEHKELELKTDFDKNMLFIFYLIFLCI